jgi:hypothetical protein
VFNLGWIILKFKINKVLTISQFSQNVKYRSYRELVPAINIWDSSPIGHQHRKMLLSRLRQWERDKHAKRLIALPKQGVVMSCVGLARASSHFLTTGDYTRFADWRFVHRARGAPA